MDPAQWWFQYSPTMSSHPTAASQGWSFDFPQQDGVHYLVQLAQGRIVGSRLSVTFQLQKSDGVQFIESNPCPPSPMNAQVRLYFQRRNDNMTGAGQYEFYRWFSLQGFHLASDTGGLSVALSPANWESVMGKTGDTNPSAFYAAMSDVEAIGITFGGCFAGHGVFVQGGSAKLAVSNFAVE